MMRNSFTPIFVVGAPRSGTTLLASILNSSNTIFASAHGETHYFPEVLARRSQFGSLNNIAELSAALDHLLNVYRYRKNYEFDSIIRNKIVASAVIQKAVSFGGGYDGLYFSFTSTLANVHNKHIFCDHTPKHIFFIPEILELFPNAKIIICIRDPRDYLASYKHYWRKGVDPERTRCLYHPVITSLLWRKSAALARSHIDRYGQHNLILVRYEDLIKHTKSEIYRICEYSGVEPTNNMLHMSANSSFDKQSNGIYSSSVGHWKAHIPIEEGWIAQLICKQEMMMHGYEMQSLSPDMQKAVGYICGAPFALMNALYANRKTCGPLISYIRKRIGPL